jgi:hypothetical protein
MSAEIGPINLNLARKLTFRLNSRANGLADLVSQYKRLY